MHETAKDKIRLSSSGCWIDESSIFDVEDSLRGDEGENDWNTNRRFDQLVNRYNCQSPEGAFY